MVPSAEILARFDRDVVLATGRTIRIRPSRATDIDAMRGFYDRLSDRSAYLRFFGLRPPILDDLLHPPTGQDIAQRVVLVAMLGGDVIGIGEYARIPGRPEAEVAFTVADDHQRQGIATLLVEDLALIASAAGLDRLVAETLATNDAMLDVFRAVGLGHRSWYESGEVHVELALSGDSLLADRSDHRDWQAAHAAVTPFLQPRHVVVIGAGAGDRTPGGVVLAGLAERFAGRLSIGLDALDESADLAIVAVPAPDVLDVVDRCGEAAITAAVVLPAAFGPSVTDDIDRDRDLLQRARRHGTRLVGPDSLGIVSAHSGLDAAVVRPRPFTPGATAVASQSRSTGIVLSAELVRREIGVSSFVSLGRKVDLSGNDLLRYWYDDDATEVILLQLESIGDPRRFARVARAVSKRKPIVALASGRRVDDADLDALLGDSGVVRARTLDELLDVGVALTGQPAPRGRRVALLGNADGPLGLAADVAASAGLETVGIEGPPSPGEFDAAVFVCVNLTADTVDAVTVDRSAARGVPVVAVGLAGTEIEGVAATCPTPERAIRAIALGSRRGAWLAEVEAGVTDGVGDVVPMVPIRRWIRERLGPTSAVQWLPPGETYTLLERLGVPIAPWRLAASAAGTARAAGEVGLPCVIKAHVVGMVHKADEGAVILDIRTKAAAHRAFDQLVARFGSRLVSVVVQRQLPPAVELLVAGRRHDRLGPLVTIGAGGVDAEVLDDRRVILAPVTARRARAALESLRTFPLLDGFRGRRPVPLDPLIDMIERVGLLMAAIPETVGVELNPVVASPSGCVVVDARIGISPAPTGPLRTLRRPGA